MMPIYKPEKINGQVVAKPYEKTGDGMLVPHIKSTAVLHPPSFSVEHYKEPLGLLVTQEARNIVAMKAMTTSELQERLYKFALLVIENDKRTLTRG